MEVYILKIKKQDPSIITTKEECEYGVRTHNHINIVGENEKRPNPRYNNKIVEVFLSFSCFPNAKRMNVLR